MFRQGPLYPFEAEKLSAPARLTDPVRVEDELVARPKVDAVFLEGLLLYNRKGYLSEFESSALPSERQINAGGCPALA